MKLGLVLSGASLLCLAAACASTTDPGAESDLAAIDGRAETAIDIPEGTAGAKRDCTLTLKYSGSPTDDVKLAGEFTSWGDAAIPFVNGQVTLTPNENLRAGQLYGYKLVIGGQWKLDPNGKYRKIMGGQMNSALVMPSCEAGPELASGPLTASRDGKMNVSVKLNTANDGVRVTTVKASLDKKPLGQGTYSVDRTGAVKFAFDHLPKGKHNLALHSFDAQGRESDMIELPFWIEDEAFDWRDGLLYMMVIDRFADGDRSNDRLLGAPVDYDADWHGGDLQGAQKVLESGYFEKLGVRTIWLSPLNTQTEKHEIGDGNQIFSGYHGYWPVKAREVEPRFGGEQALRTFVTEAHRRGIRVLLDLINNQVHEDHEYVSQNPSWFRHSCKCGDDANGCGWSVRPYDCMFQPYLPDIDWNQPGTEKQFIADAVNWISAFDLDGFRVDAVKHVEANSVYNLRAALSKRFEQGGSRIFMVGETAVGEFDSGTFFGETFASGYDWIDAYTGPNALDGQFDFPTRHNMADGLVNGDKPMNEVEDQVRKAETRYRPGNRHVRFLNGHDNPRIASIAAKDPKLGCLWSSGCRGDQLPPLAYSDPKVYEQLKRALTVLFTMPGVPYLYMGDEVAFGGGSDPDMRRNMLFGEGLEGLEMAAPGQKPAMLTGQQADLRAWARTLGQTRVSSHALRRGDRKPIVGNDPNLWVYAYEADGDVAVVAVNRGGAVTRAVGVPGAWRSATGTGSLANGTLTLGPGESAIFVR